MYKFILNKFFYGVLVLIGVIFVIFALFNILPVDPARLTLGQRCLLYTSENKRLWHVVANFASAFYHRSDLYQSKTHQNNR